MANGQDYNNIFSGDYWSPEGYQKRKSGQKQASSDLAHTQYNNDVNFWGGLGKGIGDVANNVGFFLSNAPRNQSKTAVSSSNSRPAFRPGPSDLEMEKVHSDVAPQPMYGNKMLSDEADRSQSGVMDVNKQSSLFDDLLGKITADWGGPDKSRIDYSPLDQALTAKLGAINHLRDQTNQNYDKSDLALEQMHSALQNQMNTKGAANYNGIADTQKANLNADNQQGQANLQNIKNEDMAKRAAMLKDLGIEAAGAAPDPSADVLSQAQASIASRSDANVTNAEQNRGTNLAFNQGVSNSVGQAGVERRSDLTNQLQNILGRLNMTEADAQQKNAEARYQLEQNAGNQQYQQWRDQKGFLSDTLNSLQQDARDREKMAMDQQAAGAKTNVSGFAGLGQDLLNTGYDPNEVQHAMGILSGITSSDYMKGIDPNAGYDKASILNKLLQKNGVTSPMLALQLATNYANLGNVSKYQQSPY